MAIKPVIVKLDAAPANGRRNGRDAVSTAAPAARAHEVPMVRGLQQAIILPAVDDDRNPRSIMSAQDRNDTEVKFHFDSKGSKVVTMRLGSLTKQKTAAATAVVDAALGTDKPSLSRTASILSTLAANDGEPGEPQELSTPVAAVPMPPRPQIQAARPLAAFRAAVAAEELRPTQLLPVIPTQNGTYAVAASPEIEVKIEIEGFGVQTAYYHQVIEQPNVVVLVWDTRWRGMRYLPPEGESVPKMALQVAGSPRIFLVHPTAIHIPFQNYEFTVLLIEQVGGQSDA